ncbi:MAG: hypothetical protein M1536_02725 [Firmicutes bacterium]|nr:hypothetical protein [Bacillota bacterium]
MRKFTVIFLLVFIFLFIFQVAACAQESKPSCVTCHSKTGMEFEQSVHSKRDISCITCHGGDAQDIEMSAHSKAKGFKGRIPRGKIPALCAGCHSNNSLMRQYGIPTDQYRDYLTSKHGMDFLKGDTKVAVCTDCHTSHRILPADNPVSSVSRVNVAKTCSACHADKALMSGYHLPSNQYEKYRESIHGKALLEEGNLSSATCISCHGSHSALPPGVTEIENVCGRCHSKTRDMFVKSPHQKPAQKGKMSQCISCHSVHDIKRASIDIIPGVCLKCHQKGSAQISRADEIKSNITGAQSDLSKTGEEIKLAGKTGLNTGEMDVMLKEANTDLLELAVVQHTLDVSQIEKYSNQAESISEYIIGNIKDIYEGYKIRKMFLIVIWAFILAVILLLYLKKYRIEKQRARSSSVK